MKKTLSIILCLSLLMSTFAFAFPAEQIGMSQIGVETGEEFGDVTQLENESNVTLAAEDETIVKYDFSTVKSEKTLYDPALEEGATEIPDDTLVWKEIVLDDYTTITYGKYAKKVTPMEGGVEGDTDKYLRVTQRRGSKTVNGDNRIVTVTYTPAAPLAPGKYKIKFDLTMSPKSQNNAATTLKDQATWNFGVYYDADKTDDVALCNNTNWISLVADGSNYTGKGANLASDTKHSLDIEVELTAATSVFEFGLGALPAGLNTAVYAHIDNLEIAKVNTPVTVNFDLNGGEVTGSDLVEMDGITGTALTLPGAETVQREFYTMVGWATKQDATAGAFTYTPIHSDIVAGSTEITLYAVWQENKYDATLDFNGGTSDLETTYTFSEKDGTQSFKLPTSADVTNGTKILAGWSVESDVKAAGATVQVDGPVTFTAVWKDESDFGTVTPSATAPKFGATNVDLRYPVAYYTFDEEISAGSVTLENLNQPDATGVYYDAETNSVWVFANPKTSKPGSTINFAAWSSHIVTADGENFLTFPAAKFTLGTEMPTDGKNLAPFANMEYGWSPFYTGHVNAALSLEVEEDGNHYVLVNYKGNPAQSWLNIGHTMVWKPNTTYKISGEAKVVGYANGYNDNTHAESVTFNVKYTTVYQDGENRDHPTSNFDHSSGGVSSKPGDDWKSHAFEKKIRSSVVVDNNMEMNLFSNPPGNPYATLFAVDNLEIYEKVGVSFDAGHGSTLIGTKPETQFGFNGDVVTLPNAADSYTADDSRWSVQGWTDGENVYAYGEQYTVDGAVTLVPNLVTDETYYTVSFDAGESTSQFNPVNVIAGDIIDVNSYEFEPVAPNSQKFVGWMLNGELVVAPLAPEADAELVAVYALRDEVVFDSPVSIKYIRGSFGNSIAYDEELNIAHVRPADGQDIYIIVENLQLPAALYNKILVAYDTTLGGADNKFVNESCNPVIYFTNDSGAGHSEATKLVPVSKAIDESNPNHKVYEYKADSVATWTGLITDLRVDPYNGVPEWGVAYIKAISKDIVEAVEITDITAPSTGKTPDLEASVPTGVKYAVESVTWHPEVSKLFAGLTEYTVKVVVKSTDENTALYETTTATVNGNDADVVYNAENGTLTVSYTFAATADYEPFDFVIDGADTITVADGTVTLTPVITPVNEGVVIPTDVTWSVDNSDIAEVSANGVVTALDNGTVIVTATSVYNPAKTATHTITLSNQTAPNWLTFSSGTGATDVTNIPDAIKGKRTVSLSSVEAPVRPGFVFTGWTLDPVVGDTVTSVDLSDGNKTVYAMWSAGYVWEFNEDGNLEGFGKRDSTVEVVGGVLKVTNTANSGDADINISGLSIPASVFKKVIVRMKPDKGNSFKIFFKSTANGGALSEGDSVSYPYKASSDFQIMEFDFSAKPNWSGNITGFRMDYSNLKGMSAEIDYIRIVNNSVESFGVEGIADPVAKQPVPTTATALDTSKYTVVGVTWTPAPFENYYFAGDTQYTVNVELAPKAGSVLSATPISATINGQPATVAPAVTDGNVVLSYTFPNVTEHVESMETKTLTLISATDDDSQEEKRKIFVGDTFPLGSTAPATTPNGLRWIGWFEEGSEEFVGDVVVTEDKTYYAAYEVKDWYDFSIETHRNNVSSVAGEETLAFENGAAVIYPQNSSHDIYLQLTDLDINAADYGMVEVVYDTTIGGEDNKFTTSSTPYLYYAYASNQTSWAGTRAGTVIGAVAVDGGIKYTYDMQSSEGWIGEIGGFRFDPYNGFPEWGVRAVKFIPNEVADQTITITGVDAPETWIAPDTTAAVNSIYSVTSVEWDGEMFSTGEFKNETEYTVKVKVKTTLGYKFDAENIVATIDGNEATVEYDASTATAIVSYTYPATEPLTDTVVKISGGTTITRAGRYLELKASVKGADGTTLPNKAVVWSIDDESIATVAQNGRVTPILDGTVTVTATSVYNTEASDTHEIVITNQGSMYTVTYDKNTSADVADVPASEEAKGNYNVSDVVLTRDDGYVFAGWGTDKVAETAVTQLNITSDTTLYAIWVKGMMFEMDAPFTEFAKSGFNHSFVDGHLVMEITGNDPIINFNFANGVFKASDYSRIETRFTSDAPSGGLTKYNTAKAETEPGVWSFTIPAWSASNPGPYLSSMQTSGWTCGGLGEYVVKSYDLTATPAWKDYIGSVRLDYIENNPGAIIKVDYVRFYNDNRTVTLDLNGGTFDGSEESVVKTVTRGYVNAGVIPTLEGSKFMGWSDKNDGTGELYTGQLPVTEDVTFYAVWNPSVQPTEDVVSDADNGATGSMTVKETDDGVSIKSSGKVTPVIELGDLTITDNTKTILVSFNSTYSSMDSDANDIKIAFTTQSGNHEISLFENVSRKFNAPMDSVDLSGYEEFDGDITDVKLIFPTGVVSNLTVNDVTFTDAATAENIIDAYYEAEANKNANNATSGDGTGGTDRKEYPIQEQPTQTTPSQPDTKPEENKPSTDPFVAFTQNKGAIKFDFTNDVDSAIFKSYRHTSLTNKADGIATVTSTGPTETDKNSPAIFAPNNMEIDAATHRYVIIRAKLNMGAQKSVRVYFNTDSEPGNSESKAVSKSFKANGEYEQVVFDMSSNPSWKGTIKGMFFSFSGNAIGTCDFDYVMFANEIPEDKPTDAEKFKFVNEYSENRFEDVKTSDWFYGDVEKSYKLGLMNGKSETTFVPDGTVTIAEAITVAARIHAIYNGKTITAGTGAQWYAPYVTYAETNKIIKKGEYADVTAVATRVQVAKIIALSAPDAWFNAINVFNAIPDVPASNPAFAQIRKLYNAGVIIGIDDAYNFNPDANIKRSEMSAIINRIAIKDSRKRVVTQDEIDAKRIIYTADDLAANATLGNCEAGKLTVRDGVAYGSGKDLGGRADPIVMFSSFIKDFKAADCKQIKVGLKSTDTPTPVIYFTTPSGSWAEERCVAGKAQGAADANGVITFVFDMSAHKQWTGDITTFRLDPYNKTTEFGVSFVELVP